MSSTNKKSILLSERAEQIYDQRYFSLASKTDQLFAYLFIFQWFLGIAFAIFLSPHTWFGEYSQVHIHVYAAIFLGGTLALLPAYLIYRNPGAQENRLIVGVVQILFSVLFIHLTGGRIETHFHIFGSLAFLAIYRDWKVLAIATVVTVADHLVRGYYWPQSVYGVLTATPWRAIEHGAWVIFEDIILLYALRVSLGELRSICLSQANLEESIATIEDKVIERTKELSLSQKIVTDQQQTLMAHSKMSALGEMAGGIAHEINTPLATIKILSSQGLEVLKTEPVDKQCIGEMIETIEKTTDRIAQIVRGLRAFSRDGSQDPFSNVNIRQLIDETLSFCHERFLHGGTQVLIENFDPKLCFYGRSSELSQVLLNLLNNAHDAIHSMPEKWIKISVTQDETWTELRVTDSGQGIPEKVRDKIFQPFFTTKEIGKGTGLGLAIAIGIIRSHKGELVIDEPNLHTCFIIRLPSSSSSALVA